MIKCTSQCSRYGHPNFCVSLDETQFPIDGDVRHFLHGLEDAVAAGEKFKPGQTFQVGWMLTQIAANRDGSLSIHEPDFKTMPIKWNNSIALTLLHLRLQKDTCVSVVKPDEIAFPSIRHSAVVCTRLGTTSDVAMGRGPPSDPADSGWFCGCTNQRHNHKHPRELVRVSLYEAAIRFTPRIIPYLALPQGVAIVEQNGIPIVFRNGQRLDFKAGSYLAARTENV